MFFLNKILHALFDRCSGLPRKVNMIISQFLIIIECIHLLNSYNQKRHLKCAPYCEDHWYYSSWRSAWTYISISNCSYCYNCIVNCNKVWIHLIFYRKIIIKSKIRQFKYSVVVRKKKHSDEEKTCNCLFWMNIHKAFSCKVYSRGKTVWFTNLFWKRVWVNWKIKKCPYKEIHSQRHQRC